MTTATVSVYKINQLCDQALETILRKLKVCDEVMYVEYDKPHLAMGSALRSVTLVAATLEHYKNCVGCLVTPSSIHKYTLA